MYVVWFLPPCGDSQTNEMCKSGPMLIRECVQVVNWLQSNNPVAAVVGFFSFSITAAVLMAFRFISSSS